MAVIGCRRHWLIGISGKVAGKRRYTVAAPLCLPKINNRTKVKTSENLGAKNHSATRLETRCRAGWHCRNLEHLNRIWLQKAPKLQLP